MPASVADSTPSGMDLPRVGEVPGQADAGRHPGERREDDREDEDERIAVGDGLQQSRSGSGRRPPAARPKENATSETARIATTTQSAFTPMRAHRAGGPAPRRMPVAGSEMKRGSKPMPVSDVEDPRQRPERLGERDHVEGDRYRLREVERHADRAADRRAERARDDEVLATAFDPPVRGDLRDRQRGRHRDEVAEEDDQRGRRASRRWPRRSRSAGT